MLSQHARQGLDNGRSPSAIEICDQGPSRKRVIAPIASTTDGFRLLPMHAKCLTVVASRLSNYCAARGILPEEQCGFRLARSTVNMLFAVRRRQELGRARKFPCTCMCFIHLQPSAESVRCCRPRAAVGGTHTLRRTSEDACSHSPVRRRHAGTRACT